MKFNLQLRSVPDELDSCSIGDTERHDGLMLTLVITGDEVSPSNQNTALPQRPYYSPVTKYLRAIRVQLCLSVHIMSATFLITLKTKLRGILSLRQVQNSI